MVLISLTKFLVQTIFFTNTYLGGRHCFLTIDGSNVYILIEFHGNNPPANESLKRPERYSTINFELIKNIFHAAISIMPLFWKVFHRENQNYRKLHVWTEL